MICACKHLVVLDNGLGEVGGHSFSIARGLVDALEPFPVAIYGPRQIQGDLRDHLRLTPHFTHSLYSDVPASRQERLVRRAAGVLRGRAPDASPSERHTSEALNAAFCADLERLPRSVWAAQTLVLLPGLFQHQIRGLARFVEAHAQAIEGVIVCQLMFEPTWLPWSVPSRLGSAAYRDALGRLHPRLADKIVFVAENPLVAERYRRDFGVPVEVVPPPLIGSPSTRCGSGPPSLGFFGYAKVEKGFDLLPDAVARCLDRRPDLSFVIQVQHCGEEPRVVAAEARLRRLQGVRCLDGALPEDEFRAHAASVDIVMLPYDPALFGVRGSGVFSESVTAGRPVVASRGTWAARCIEAGDAIGEMFAPHESSAFAAAILRLCDSLPERAAAAQRRAAAFADSHSFDNYIRGIFASARMSAPVLTSGRAPN